MKNKTIFKINLIYFIAFIGVALLFALGYFGIIKNEFLSSFLIQIVVIFAIPLLLYTLLISRNVKTTFKDVGFKKISGKFILLSFVLGIVLYFINRYVANFFSVLISLLGYESLNSSSTIELNYELLLKELILSCVLPAICEEFLHRGLLLNASKKVADTKYCLLISSILFGLMHLNINQFFYASILGALMGYVALATDNIFPCIIIHFTNNFLSNYFFYGKYFNFPLANTLDNFQNVLISNAFMYIFFTIAFLGFLIRIYVLIVRYFKKETIKNTTKALIKDLNIENADTNELILKSSYINSILSNYRKPKPTFTDKLFLIPSLCLGILITISTFIWGIL